MTRLLYLLTSQRYRDPGIVAAKRAARDYLVQVSRPFCLDGLPVRLLVDGHHSYTAALADRVWPLYVEVDGTYYEELHLLAQGQVAACLRACQNDSPYHLLPPTGDLDYAT